MGLKEVIKSHLLGIPTGVTPRLLMAADHTRTIVRLKTGYTFVVKQAGLKSENGFWFCIWKVRHTNKA